MKLQRIMLLLLSAMSKVLLARIRREATETEQSKAHHSISTFIWEWLVIHTYLNSGQNPQVNEMGYSTSLCIYEETIALQYIKMCPFQVRFFAEENLI